MAETLRIAPSYLSDVELGRRPPFRAEMILRCVRVIGLSDAETRTLMKAASAERGAVELEVDVAKPEALDAATSLMREWSTFDTDEFRQLADFVKTMKEKKA